MSPKLDCKQKKLYKKKLFFNFFVDYSVYKKIVSRRSTLDNNSSYVSGNIINKTDILNMDNYKKIKRDFTERTILQNNPQLNDIILLADDNQIINNANKNILEQILAEKNCNMDIILCFDGSEILKYLFKDSFKNKIKYIITDENMELLNGSDAIRMIRFLESKNIFNKIKIISLSCHEDLNVIDSLFQAGADHVLVKPLIKSAILKIF